MWRAEKGRFDRARWEIGVALALLNFELDFWSPAAVSYLDLPLGGAPERSLIITCFHVFFGKD